MHGGDLKARWTTFLKEYADIGPLRVRWPDERSLTISFREIHEFDSKFAEFVLANPSISLIEGGKALRELCAKAGSDISPEVRIIDLPPDQQRIVRGIRHEDVAQMLAVDAVAVKISSVRPRVIDAVFRCCNGDCGGTVSIHQSNEQELIEPSFCNSCNASKPAARFELLPAQSVMENTQFIELQEPPEKLGGGLQPERLTCLVEGEIAGMILPGDRIIANGELFVRSKRKGGKTTTLFEIFLRVNSFERHNTPFEDVKISPEDEEQIRELSYDPEIYELLTRSIAPSVFGMGHIKESLLLQLFGGVARRNPDGTRLRGDMHILLMGDPGTAKSQLLYYMSELSPRGQYTSGRSATAAGLTAAAVHDTTGDGWTLEAGVLPLADSGLAAIDEFDKMGDGDRSSIHEAMEQQTISISKAGMHISLRTRCSLLAAANPRDGRFRDRDEIPYTKQVNLPPPLFSRFDLIWIITDTPAEEHDTMIATHILTNRQRGVSEQAIDQGTERDVSKSDAADEIAIDHEGRPVIGRELFRKYVAYAKRNHTPVLDEEAMDRIRSYYVETRRKGTEFGDMISIDARSLEAIARLSEASAKVRLSDEATIEDVLRGIRLFETWRHELMGDEFDNTAIESGKTASTRSLERFLRQLINDIQQGTGTHATTIMILERANTEGFEDDKVLAHLDRMWHSGQLFKPSGHDTWQIT